MPASLFPVGDVFGQAVVIGYVRPPQRVEVPLTDQEPPRLRVTYKYTDQHRTIPVTGGWGGPTPNGHVVVSFYHERVQLPEVTIQSQRSGQELPEGNSSELPVERLVEVTMVLRPDVANSIGDWLKDHAARLLEPADEESQSNESANKQPA